MKHKVLLVVAIFIVHFSFGQNVSLKNDTIFASKAPYAILKKVQNKAVGYSVLSLYGYELMELHNSRVDIKGKPAYVVTFLNDKKQGIIIRDNHFPLSLVNEIVSYNLVKGGTFINEQSEAEFLKAHPLPDGYTDVDQLIEY